MRKDGARRPGGRREERTRPSPFALSAGANAGCQFHGMELFLIDVTNFRGLSRRFLLLALLLAPAPVPVHPLSLAN